MSDPRQPLLRLLRRYEPADSYERSMWERLFRFVSENPRCFDRSLAAGHVTGSAWIVDSRREFALLHHHRKLAKWLQPGGHADGEPDILKVALREAREETGIEALWPVSGDVFDVDVHAIHALGAVSGHYHFDVRLLFEADRSHPLRVSDESHELAWLPLNEIERWTVEESVLRMVRKTARVGIR